MLRSVTARIEPIRDDDMRDAITAWTWIYGAIAAASGLFAIADPGGGVALPAEMLGWVFAALAVLSMLPGMWRRMRSEDGIHLLRRGWHTGG